MKITSISLRSCLKFSVKKIKQFLGIILKNQRAYTFFGIKYVIGQA